MLVHKEKLNGYKIKIYQDDLAESPREWDNLGTMVCFHSNYNLGDKHNYSDMEDFLTSIAWNDYNMDPDDYPSEEKFYSSLANKMEKDYISLSLYLYDHSGITMACTPFSCGWDSGQVGFIYVKKSDVLKEYNWKTLTKERRELVKSYLKGKVKTYDQFLTGDVYYYTIKNKTTGEEDSCGGFFGLEYCIEEARNNCVANTPPQ